MSTIQSQPIAKSMDPSRLHIHGNHDASLNTGESSSFRATFEATLQRPQSSLLGPKESSKESPSKAHASPSDGKVKQPKEKDSVDSEKNEDPLTKKGDSHELAGMHESITSTTTKPHPEAKRNPENPQKRPFATEDQKASPKVGIQTRMGHELEASKKQAAHKGMSQAPANRATIQDTKEPQTKDGLTAQKTEAHRKTENHASANRVTIQESKESPSFTAQASLNKKTSEKTAPTTRPIQDLAATFTQRGDSKPILSEAKTRQKTLKTALTSAFNLTPASHQGVSRNHGTPRASRLSEGHGLAQNAEPKVGQPNEWDTMKHPIETPSNLELKQASSPAKQPMMDTGSLSADWAQTKANSMFGHALRETPITLGENSLQAHSVPRVEAASSLPSSQTQLQAVQRLQSMIQDHVTVLRNGGQQTLQVAIRPESGLAMMLTLQQVENQVLVVARMDESTANLLKPQWQELQRELEAQGIKLAHQDIGNPSNARYQGSSSEEDTSPFHRPSNSQGKQEENHRMLALSQPPLNQGIRKSIKGAYFPTPEIF